jgi:hypothetical protein
MGCGQGASAPGGAAGNGSGAGVSGTSGTGGATGTSGAGGATGSTGAGGGSGAATAGASGSASGGSSGAGSSGSGGGATAGSASAGAGASGASGTSGTSSTSGSSTGSAGASGSGGTAPTGPYAWNNVAIGGGGFVSGIVFSPAQAGLAYARTDVGGFYRWTSANGAWTPLTDGFSAAQGNLLGGESIAPDPVNANIVYAAAGMYQTSGNGVILRSTDQGATWTSAAIGVPMGGNDLGRGMGERLAVDPNNPTILYFGSRGHGLLKSTDSASTWNPVSGFPAMGDATYGLPVVVFDKRGGTSAGSTTIYVAPASKSTGSNLYATTNGGSSWSAVAGGPTGLMAHHAAIGTDGTLWLAYGSDYGPYNVGGGTLTGQVWKYAAGTWTNVTPPAANWSAMAGGISVDVANPQHVVVSTLDWYGPDRLLATTDGGTTWSVIADPPASWNPSGSTYNDEGAAYLLSGGAQIGTGATNWVEAVALDPFTTNHAMYGTGSGVWESTNIASATGSAGQGVTWTFSDNGLEETVPLYLVPSVKGAFLGAIGDLGGMRNTSLSTYSSTGQYTNPTFSNTNGIDFAESNPNLVVRVGNSGAAATDVAVSSDNGQTWTPAASAPPGYTTDNQMQSVAIAADGNRFLVAPATGYGNPAFTTNNGSTWTACSGLPSGAMLASDRVTAGTFYATSGGTLYVSTDGGATFTSASTFSESGAPRAVFGQAGEVWVAANGGNLYRFTGAGATRTQVATVSAASGVGFGMAASGQTHPAVFLIGTVSGQYGFFRSDDGTGASWTRINDDAHQYGNLQGNYVAGDEGIFGRVYLTTGGRGYVYGDPR